MLYEIWYVSPNVCIPMVEVLDVMNLYRDQVRSTDLAKLEATVEYLEDTSPSDIEYPIRPVLEPQL